MGGPAAGILLREAPSEEQKLALKSWLTDRARFQDHEANQDLSHGWQFFLQWPIRLGQEPPGGACLGSIQLHAISTEEESSGGSFLTPDDWRRYEHALGWLPVCEVEVSIFCSRPRDHMLLAWLCFELATKFEGMIDLDGMLPLPERHEWQSVGLTARVVDVEYDIDSTRQARVQVVDPEFLTWWMRQPNFHMIK